MFMILSVIIKFLGYGAMSNNDPHLCECKGTKKIVHVQIFMQKKSFYRHSPSILYAIEMLSPCWLYAVNHDRYTIDTRKIYDRYTID